MQYRGRLFASVTALVLVATAWQAWGDRPAAAAAQAGMIRPAGVPDLLDPAVQAQFVVLSVARLAEDPDFPALFLGNITGESPRFLLVILDARNGKETWSLREDVPVFFLLMADAETIQRAFLDEGFAANGIASGSFIASGPEAGEHLLARLRESHRRLRGLTYLRPAGLSLR